MIDVHNGLTTDLAVAPRLVITQVLPHIDLGANVSALVPAGGTTTVHADITIPQLPPGDYRVFIANGAGYEGTIITVRSAIGN